MQIVQECEDEEDGSINLDQFKAFYQEELLSVGALDSSLGGEGGMGEEGTGAHDEEWEEKVTEVLDLMRGRAKSPNMSALDADDGGGGGGGGGDEESEEYKLEQRRLANAFGSAAGVGAEEETKSEIEIFLADSPAPSPVTQGRELAEDPGKTFNRRDSERGENERGEGDAVDAVDAVDVVDVVDSLKMKVNEMAAIIADLRAQLEQPGGVENGGGGGGGGGGGDGGDGDAKGSAGPTGSSNGADQLQPNTVEGVDGIPNVPNVPNVVEELGGIPCSWGLAADNHILTSADGEFHTNILEEVIYLRFYVKF